MFAALVIWLGWTLAAVLLFNALEVEGLLLSLLLLGAILAASIAYAMLWLRCEMRNERSWEAKRTQDLVWLNSRISPRRPLPHWVGGMARIDLLDAAWRGVRDKRPARVLELGSGLSTLAVAYGLQANGFGELYSLEDNPGHAAQTRRLLAEHGLAAYATIIDAPLRKMELDGEVHSWYEVADIPKDVSYDILLVDGPAGHLAPSIRYPALPVLNEYLSADAMILVDDTDRSRERNHVDRWLADFSELQKVDCSNSQSYTELRISRSHPTGQ